MELQTKSLAMPYFKYVHDQGSLPEPSKLLASSSRPWFTSTELSQIYNCPPVNLQKPTTIGVISLGGGLFGSLSQTGVLTNGDVQAYWTALNIPTSNHPTVIIKTVGNTTNMPSGNSNDIRYGATLENTIDIETIGAWYPSSNLTIILYLADQYKPVNTTPFYDVFNYALNSNVVVGTKTFNPSTISVSWGFTEIFNTATINALKPLLSNAATNGKNIFCASGDNGSTDGIPGRKNYVNFPSCSPYVTACGGTNLICPTFNYTKSTVESAWTNGGGGISKMFKKPAYQKNVMQTAKGRCTPDIALNADPSTPVVYLFDNKTVTVGGTSIVSPAMAAVAETLNINYFLNTKLYRVRPTAFNDIKTGNNGGYKTAKGYDLCTGFGSINGVTLKALLTNLRAENPTEELAQLSMNYSVKLLKINTNFQFIARKTPSKVKNIKFNWESSNPSIVSVSDEGLCTALSAGSAVISASLGDNVVCANVSVTEKSSKFKNIPLKQKEECIINLKSKEFIYSIINEHTSIVDAVYNNGELTLIGKGVGTGEVIVHDANNSIHAVLLVTVV